MFRNGHRHISGKPKDTSIDTEFSTNERRYSLELTISSRQVFSIFHRTDKIRLCNT